MNMDKIISIMNDADQKKMEFARYFLNKMLVFDIKGGRIHLKPMDVTTFQYFIFFIVMDYESKYR